MKAERESSLGQMVLKKTIKKIGCALSIVAFLGFGIYTNAMNYASCQAYYKQATTTIDSIKAYSILYGNKPHLIAFSTTPLHSSKIIKKDPFLGLYLLDGRTPKSYRLKPLDSFSHTLALAAVNANTSTPGKVINFERGVFDLGRFVSRTNEMDIFGVHLFAGPVLSIKDGVNKKTGVGAEIGVLNTFRVNKNIYINVQPKMRMYTKSFSGVEGGDTPVYFSLSAGLCYTF